MFDGTQRPITLRNEKRKKMRKKTSFNTFALNFWGKETISALSIVERHTTADESNSTHLKSNEQTYGSNLC